MVKYISGHHYVTHGCNRDYPSGIREAHESEQHAVQCCDDSLFPWNPLKKEPPWGTCHDYVRKRRSGYICVEKADYAGAVATCAYFGEQLNRKFSLCPRNEELNYRCCNSECDYDSVTMWISDHPPQGSIS